MKKKIFIVIALLMTFIFIMPTSANAASVVDSIKSIQKNNKSTLGGNGAVRTGAIPADYYFGFGRIKPNSPNAIYSNVTAVTSKQQNAWEKYSNALTYKAMFEKNTKPSQLKTGYSVCYPKIGIYNDSYIDVKGEVMDFSKNTTKEYKGLTPIIAFNSGRITDSTIKERPGIEAMAVNWVRVKWSFTKSNGKCTGSAVTVKGNTTYWDVDVQQGVASSNGVIARYVSNKSNNKLMYSSFKTSSGTSYQYIYDKGINNQSATDKRYAYTEIFSGSSLNRIYTFYRSGGKPVGKAYGGITHSYNAVNPVTPPNPTKSVNVKNVTETTKFEYRVSQKVPLQDSTNYHKSFIMYDQLDKAIDMSGITKSTVKVVRKADGANVTSKYYTISVSGNTVEAKATAAALKDENFYGETYELVIPAKILSSIDYSKYKKDSAGNYIIPNKGNTKIDNITRTTNEVDVLYKYPVPNKIEPPVKSVDTKYVSDASMFTYRVKQKVPYQAVMNYYKSFEIVDTLDNAIDMEKTKQQNIKVIRIDTGAVVSEANSLFTVNVSGNKVTAKATESALKNKDFYNQTYELVIPCILKSNYNFNGYKKDSAGKYIIPNKASTITNNVSQNSQEVDVIYTKEMPIKSVDAEIIRHEKEFNYTISHEVPELNASSYYKEYTFTDILEEPLQIKDSSKVKIVDNNNSDVTSNFDISIEGQKVTANLKNPSDSSFYGKTYSFILTTSLKASVEEKVDMSKYMNDNRYVIPDTASITIKNNQGEVEELKTNTVNVYYYPEIAPKKSVDMENVTDIYNKKGRFTYTIEKDIINYSKNSWYSSFELKDVFEPVIQIDSTSSVKVINDKGEDVTNWFDIKLNSNTLIAKLKDENNNENFYGRSYKFIIKAGIKDNANLNKYKKGNQYVIPNKASIIYDKNIEDQTNEVNVKIDVPKEVPKVEKRLVKVSNTASPLSVAIITIGLALVIAAAYFVYKNYSLSITKK